MLNADTFEGGTSPQRFRGQLYFWCFSDIHLFLWWSPVSRTFRTFNGPPISMEAYCFRNLLLGSGAVCTVTYDWGHQKMIHVPFFLWFQPLSFSVLLTSLSSCNQRSIVLLEYGPLYPILCFQLFLASSYCMFLIIGPEYRVVLLVFC